MSIVNFNSKNLSLQYFPPYRPFDLLSGSIRENLLKTETFYTKNLIYNIRVNLGKINLKEEILVGRGQYENIGMDFGVIYLYFLQFLMVGCDRRHCCCLNNKK